MPQDDDVLYNIGGVEFTRSASYPPEKAIAEGRGMAALKEANVSDVVVARPGRGGSYKPEQPETLAPGTKVTTRTRTGGMNQDDIISRFNDYSDANSKLADLMASITGTAAATSEEERKAALARGAAEAKTTSAEGANLAARKDTNTSDAKLLGVDTTNPQSRFIELQRQRMEAAGVKDQLRGRIDEEDKITVFDDPLRWAINQFTLPTLKKTFNAANTKEYMARQEIAANQQLASAQQQLDLGITGDMIKQSAAAKAQEQLAKATFDAAKIAKEGTHIQAQLLMQQSALNNSNQTSYMQLARLLDESAQRTVVQKADEAMLPAIQVENLRRASIGALPLTAAEVKLMNSAQKAELIKRAALAPGKLGASPGETFSYIKDLGADVGTTDPQLAKLLGTQMNSPEFEKEMQLRKQEPAFHKLSYDQQVATVLDTVAGNSFTALRKIGSYDKTTDPAYKVKLGSAVLIPALASNPFTPEVQKLMDSKGLEGQVTHKELEGIAVAMMLAGKKPADVAKNLSEFYRTLQTQQWVLSKAAAAGYEKPMELKTTTMQVGGQQVDQWNPVAVEHWLMTQAANKANQSFMGDIWNATTSAAAAENKRLTDKFNAEKTQKTKDFLESKQPAGTSGTF